ncbi:MAG: hypothetical protein K2J82_05000 [Muribaculaceae bacterium]|nr:hypothetical protein [Muribaculaceae bacterium]MDE6753954.1 hypothetical protein [Muribaculaceae bacterium]
MEDLGKVNSMQLYEMWKNLTIGLTSVAALQTLSHMLPYFLSPVVALVTAAVLYVYIYNKRSTQITSCMLVPFAMLYGCLGYAFLSILINVLFAWGLKSIPNEFIFFDGTYVPILMLAPICFFISGYFLLFRKSLKLCKSCRVSGDDAYETGLLKQVLKVEAPFQLRNLTIIFGLLSVIAWGYFLLFYVNINFNARDKYIFVWVAIIVYILDELYFIARYYNLYLDLKESNEIITQEELSDMTAKTYIRYYVICGNKLYVDTHTVEPHTSYKEVVDTPFFTKRTMNGIPVEEVKRIIGNMTGYTNGELRFFFGRKSSEIANHSILRYFYFLDGEPSDYPDIKVDGEWMDFDRVKYLYSNNPGKLGETIITDTTRLATIMLTEKTFDENGFRKSKIKMYNPSFNLIDVRNSSLDFQDDKWINVSLFNSDTPMFRLKRWWRKFLNGSSKKKNGSLQ